MPVLDDKVVSCGLCSPVFWASFSFTVLCIQFSRTLFGCLGEFMEAVVLIVPSPFAECVMLRDVGARA